MHRRITVICVSLSLLLWAGCKHPPCGYADNCFYACATDSECIDEAGTICRPLSSSFGALGCTRPCTRTSDCTIGKATDNLCRCADPAGAGYCDIGSTEVEDPAERLRQRCDTDFDRAATCERLCACPCSFHLNCPHGTTAQDCRAGCTGAYDSFASCQKELDAYYLCAQEHAVCVTTYAQGYDGGVMCDSGWPSCWLKAPGDACPSQAAAVFGCTGSSASMFFYPTPR